MKDWILAAVMIGVGGLHLCCGFRSGKVWTRAGWVAQTESPRYFWFLMILSFGIVLAGLYVGIVGLPDRRVI